MNSIPKLIRRFIGVFAFSSALILAMNIIVFGVLMSGYALNNNASPYDMAQEAGKELRELPDGAYALPDRVSEKLKSADAWAILIDNTSLHMVWKTKNTPSTIPSEYTASDIASLSVGYLEDYPTYTGTHERGIVVLGFPQNSFWKHTRASWNYSFISHAPQIALSVLGINVLVILGIYLVANIKLLKSVKPITQGIQRLSNGKSVHIPETGALSEISTCINSASDMLQEQKNQLRKKDMARANWIAGVSHDIRTPLSMVMGYADQLAHSSQLLPEERKKATMIARQGERMKNLINDLNLASKLEYTMQPIMKKEENIVAIVRQVVVDFLNMNMQDEYAIVWETSEKLTTCIGNVDQGLLKRAVANLIQNSMSHNENGCTIYVSVSLGAGAGNVLTPADTSSTSVSAGASGASTLSNTRNCVICVEDDGIGASPEALEALRHAPHYMICDTSTTEQRHGLGLLIVQQIIDAHNGTVEIGTGTRGGFMVKLYIPVSQAKRASFAPENTTHVHD